MKHLFVTVAAAFVLLGFAIGAGAIHEIIPEETYVPLPDANSRSINEYIIKYQPYRAWRLWPGKGRLYEGTEPHGSLLTTFVNDIAYRSIKKQEGMSEGSIIVKENYAADKDFVALTVMYRVKGYNPDGGDWYWVRYAPSGKAEASGRVKACIRCHSVRKDNDYIYTGAVVGE
jgi:hypothetical protein